ncbi:MAG: hypothetical protein Q9203_000514, partial [Teloschistes exilis]
MVKTNPTCEKYDLRSVQCIFTGAAPLGKETAESLQEQYPTWKIRQGYGLTETATVICSSPPNDIWFGSSGSLLPMVEARIMSADGTEITAYDQPGELVVRSPSVVLGYLNNDEANRETFEDGWMRTGDVALFRKHLNGAEHCFIVDRMKELIKVKGMQVAPAELESHLLTHPAVVDCAVISVPDEAAGELPKAFVVKSPSVGLEENDRMLIRDIQKHVEKDKARHKWLKGGVTFLPEIPKSPSGKILRRMLKDKERESRRQQGPKLPSISQRMTHQSNNHDADNNAPSDDEALLDPSEAAEIVPDDPDHPMDSDNEVGDDDDLKGAPEEEQEIQLQNDSIAYFDHHTDSIFCIANHPFHPAIIATGGGDDTTYVFSVADVAAPVLPPSYETNPSAYSRFSIKPIAKITGHTDSISALSYTLPDGAYLLTGGLDGRLRVHSASDPTYPLIASAQEVPEINFLTPCPHPSYPNTFALGASDGSIWIYTVDGSSDPRNPLQVLQAYYLHTESATAGAWTPDGRLLATVSEDGSFYVWDPFREATAAGVTSSSGGQAVVGLTTADQRFAVEDGLFSVVIAPSGAFAVVGGAHGVVRVVGLPRLSSSTTNNDPSQSASTTKSQKGGGSKNKAGGGKKASAAAEAAGGQAGQILASLQVQTESVESLAFSPHHALLAAGSVDGSIALFDSGRNFALRRLIGGACEDELAVVKVAFGTGGGGPEEKEAWTLTSCGMDGAVR